MRISILWTGAVLFFSNLVSAQISSNSGHFTTKTYELLANPLSPNSTPARVLAASPADDDAKKNWTRANVTVAAQPFIIDDANFIAAYNLTFVEFYIQMAYDRLSFTRAGSEVPAEKFYRAVYDIDFYITDLNGNLLQTQSAHDEIKAANYDETIAPNNYRITVLSASLKSGIYQLRAVVTDKETGKNYEVTNKFSVRDFSGSILTLSDLQFSRNIQVDSSANAFVKHNRRIEPNVPHVYGQFVGQLFIYYEIYNLTAPNHLATRDSTMIQTAAADSFQTLYVIRNELGEEVKQLWKFGRKPGTSCVQSVVLPIANLKSGRYSLTVRVFDNANASYAETTGRFNVQWDVFSFKDKKFEEILDQMRYVASADELKQLAQLPEADRQRGLFEFWQRRDPTPGTPRNEAMEEYYRRLNYANGHFRWQGGEGWKSPQGQIYLQYGPPDNLQRFSSSAFDRANNDWMSSSWSSEARQENDSRRAWGRSPAFNTPYEVWEYTQQNRSFIFVDFRGVGIYELVDPLSLRNLGLR